MSKFTQEDLLNAAGLKLGDRILYSFYKSPVTVSYNEQDGFHFMADNGKHFYLYTLIGHDYTVITQPKYTLTETEKHIVLAIDEKWKWIARDESGDINLFNYKPVKLPRSFDYSPFDNKIDEKLKDKVTLHLVKVFPFIQWSDEEPVSLDELREIAKK